MIKQDDYPLRKMADEIDSDFILEVEERKALPVWVLPLVTSWRLTPHQLLERLNKPLHDIFRRFPSAFNLTPSHKPCHIPPQQWENLLVKIRILDANLRKEGVADDQSYVQWRDQSIKILQEYEAYVWLDDFKNWFDRDENFCKESWIEGIEDIDENNFPDNLEDLLKFDDLLKNKLRSRPVELTLNPLLSKASTTVSEDIAAFAEKLRQRNKTMVSKAVTTDKIDEELTKLQKQQAAISKAIQGKGYNPLSIPDGGKGTLQIICENDYPDLFDATTSFDNAWKKSVALFRMANHASYSKRGKT
jgi:hypothetical protein